MLNLKVQKFKLLYPVKFLESDFVFSAFKIWKDDVLCFALDIWKNISILRKLFCIYDLAPRNTNIANLVTSTFKMFQNCTILTDNVFLVEGRRYDRSLYRIYLLAFNQTANVCKYVFISTCQISAVQFLLSSLSKDYIIHLMLLSRSAVLSLKYVYKVYNYRSRFRLRSFKWINILFKVIQNQ